MNREPEFSQQRLVRVRVIATGRQEQVQVGAICSMPLPAGAQLPALASEPVFSGTCVGCCKPGQYAYIPDAGDNWWLCEIDPFVN